MAKFQKKSEVSVRDACKMAYDKMPMTFNAQRFCASVRVITRRPALMDGTILRRLREIRADFEQFQYKCVDPDISLYKKL